MIPAQRPEATRDGEPGPGRQATGFLMRPKAECVAVLITLAATSAAYRAVLAWHGIEPTGGLLILYAIAFAIVLVLWVDDDSRGHREIYRPFEFEYLTLLFWLPYLPWYLWRTRGRSGLLIGAGFIGLFFLGDVAAWLAGLLRS